MGRQSDQVGPNGLKPSLRGFYGAGTHGAEFRDSGSVQCTDAGTA
jgi:hypothetical protein